MDKKEKGKKGKEKEKEKEESQQQSMEAEKPPEPPKKTTETYDLTDKEGNVIGTIPTIGFGTYQIRRAKDMDVSIKAAYDAGYRLFDTAVMYSNEKLLGDAIKKLGKDDKDNNGVLNEEIRSQLFITTKILPQDMTAERTKNSIEQSLKKFDLTYIDLVLIHWPQVSDLKDRLNVWKTLEEAVKEKKVRYIGVSNFLQSHLEHIMTVATIKPVVNQIECHPLYYDKETIDYCHQHGIVVEAYCPLAEFDSKLIKNKVINEIAEKYKKTVPQVILKWIITHKVVPLPKSCKPERIKENINLDDFEIAPEDMEQIDALNCGYKIDWDPKGIQ